MRVVSVLVAALVLTASAPAAAPAVRATLRTSTATPTVDDPWRWKVVVKDRKGKPLVAKMRLQILLGTLVVGCWKRGSMVQCTGVNSGSWIAFRGTRRGVLTWPAESVGVKLTFQAVVRAAGKTVRLRAPVKVQPKT